VADLEIVRVSWADPRAQALRAAMDVEMRGVYHEAVSREFGRARHRALSVDPADVRATVLALDAGGDPVGHAAMRELRGDWEVKRVIVASAQRGHGVGQAIMTELEVIARGAERSRLILQTGPRQPDAVALYERLAYTRIAVYEPYIEAIPGSICFEKLLG
jgi:GNAT superfamily N-acetyltransferase